jgi:cell division protein FtsQ
MERRQTVAEDYAKRNVSRLLRFLGVLVAAGAAVWLMFSPWLSVSQVSTTGVSASSANAILADRGVVAGTPMVRVDVDGTERALLEDPWIAEAVIDLEWPDAVTVAIVERAPVAWMETADGWSRRALDGVSLPSEGEPDPEMAWIEMPELAGVAVETTPDVIGALEFIDALPANLRDGTVVTTNDGEIWATVDGYQVRLGRAVEMGEKAVSLVALLGESPVAGSVLVLIAPTNPAVATPGSATSTTPSGDGSTTSSTTGESLVGEGGDEVIPDD